MDPLCLMLASFSLSSPPHFFRGQQQSYGAAPAVGWQHPTWLELQAAHKLLGLQWCLGHCGREDLSAWLMGGEPGSILPMLYTPMPTSRVHIKSERAVWLILVWNLFLKNRLSLFICSGYINCYICKFNRSWHQMPDPEGFRAWHFVNFDTQLFVVHG